MTVGATDEIMNEILRDVSFPGYVNGESLTATLTHIEDQYFELTYFVAFSDGYKTRILATNDGKARIGTDLINDEDNLRMPEPGYVEAVKEDLALFSLYEPLEDVCVDVMDLPDENDVKVWALKTVESNDCDIYYRNKHHCTIERTEDGSKTHFINDADDDLT